VNWRFGDESRLKLIANLGAEPAVATYTIGGVRLFTLGDVPTCANDHVLPPWSVGWFLQS
jgi:hypothetical protein